MADTQDTPAPQDQDPGSADDYRTAFTDAAAQTPPVPSSPVEPAGAVPPSCDPPAPVAEGVPPAAPADPEPFDFNAFADRAKAVGIDVDQYQDPTSLLDGMISQLAEVREQSQAYANLLQQPPAPQQQEPQPPVPPAEPQDDWSEDKYFQDKWDIPAYDPSWDQFLQYHIAQGNLQKGAGGQYMPVPDKPLTGYLAQDPTLQQINKFQSGYERAVTGLFNEGNFYEKIWGVLREPIERLATNVAQQNTDNRLQADRWSNTINEFEAKHKDQLYAGNNLTPYGQKFYDTIDQLKQAPNDPEALLRLAAQLNPPEQPAPPAGSAPSPTPAPAAAPPEQVSQDKQQSFLEKSLQAASHQPSGRAPGVTNQDPGEYSDAELKTMFTRAYAEETAGV